MTGSVLLKLSQPSVEYVLLFSPEDGQGILEGARVRILLVQLLPELYQLYLHLGELLPHDVQSLWVLH